uniref:Uncharacterized protein n=1 Tax=Panagrellus redivivus TaxID=6233 RepID=A0A7E4ZV50_PANRE
MDSNKNDSVAPRRVLGTTSGRVIFKNISVSAVPAGDYRDSRPSFLGALKPSFEKTLHFARELTAFGREASPTHRSRFGSTPVIPDQLPPASSGHRASPYSVMRSESGSRSLAQPNKEERRRHGHVLSASEAQLSRADRGRKYALVQLDSTAQLNDARGKAGIAVALIVAFFDFPCLPSPTAHR